MSKGKHTPGPWRFKEYVEFPADVKEEWERSGREIPRFRFLTNDGQAAITSDHADNAIAYVQCQTKFKRGMGHKAECEMRDANARLIAAAPETAAERDRLKEVNAELLEALKDAVSALDADASKSPLGERHAKLAQGWFNAMYGDKARAAIAKAEGRT